MTKIRRTIERQPSKGKRILRTFGYIWLIFSMFVGALMFISAVYINAPLTVLLIPVIMILISIPMIRAARVKTEVYYEEKTEVPTDIEMQK